MLGFLRDQGDAAFLRRKYTDSLSTVERWLVNDF